jgi:hypothetical protein
MISHRRHPLLLAALAGAAILLTACGSSCGLPSPVALPAGDTPAAAGRSDNASGSGGGSTGPLPTVALPMGVRVVNLYLEKGSDAPTPIEVWTGPAAYGGKKLATVPYGTVSAYFAPEIGAPSGQAAPESHADYSLTFYASGRIGVDEELMTHGEKGATGQKLTMVATPGDPDAIGMSLQVEVDDLGSSPQGSGFTTASLPPPPAGTALLSISATALQYRKDGADVSLTPSTTDGTCIPYLEPDTGKLHDMRSSTMEMIGGTGGHDYPVAPGSSFRLNQVKDQQGIAQACADAPAAGPFDPGLSAGERAYAYLYGAALTSAKLLVVPVG